MDPITSPAELGRGEQATLDMKLRIADLRAREADVICVLWDRYHAAVTGEGHRYEYAERAAPPTG